MNRRRAGLPSEIDLNVLGMFVDRERILRRMEIADVARVCAIAPDAVRRAIGGRMIADFEFRALCVWLGREPMFFQSTELSAKREAYL